MVDVVDLSCGSEAKAFIVFKGFEGENHPGFF
jgi:hypothetical protein